MTPKGPFDLASSREFFGGWPSLPGDAEAIVMAFPVEGWRASAAVLVRQERSGRIVGEVHGAGAEAAKAWRQALATLSLDVDGRQFGALGRRDGVIGELQHRFGLVRPTLFCSPYEAAAHFVLSHRRSIAQSRATRARLAVEHGDRVDVRGGTFHAFPRPQKLRRLRVARGLDPERVTRLRGIADAALDGTLDRTRLRRISVESALTEIRGLRGIGEFFRAEHPLSRRRPRRRHHEGRAAASRRAARVRHERAAGSGRGRADRAGVAPLSDVGRGLARPPAPSRRRSPCACLAPSRAAA